MKSDLLIVSDLHCTSVGRNTEKSFLRPDVYRGSPLRHPVASLLELKKIHQFDPLLLLCPGDITDRIDVHGLSFGVSILNEISDQFGCEYYLSSIGNHDIDSRKIHEIVYKSSDPLHLVKTVFPDRFPVPKGDGQDAFWSQGLSFHKLDSISVLNLNSVFHAGSEQLAKRGMCHDTQLSKIQELLTQNAVMLREKPWVAMCHHHPVQHELHSLGSEDLMENGEALLKILAAYNCDLVIHGHKHHSRLTYYYNGGNRLPVFSAGSFSEHLYPELAQVTCNMFHSVNISSKGRGIIKNWKFLIGHGWQPCSIEKSGVEHIYGFSSVELLYNTLNDAIAWLNLQNFNYLNWSQFLEEVHNINFLSTSEMADFEKGLEDAGYIIHRKIGIPIEVFKKIPNT